MCEWTDRSQIRFPVQPVSYVEAPWLNHCRQARRLTTLERRLHSQATRPSPHIPETPATNESPPVGRLPHAPGPRKWGSIRVVTGVLLDVNSRVDIEAGFAFSWMRKRQGPVG
jgi:hypothetical protein